MVTTQVDRLKAEDYKKNLHKDRERDWEQVKKARLFPLESCLPIAYIGRKNGSSTAWTASQNISPHPVAMPA